MWSKMEAQNGGRVFSIALMLSIFLLEIDAQSCGPMGYKAEELLGY